MDKFVDVYDRSVIKVVTPQHEFLIRAL